MKKLFFTLISISLFLTCRSQILYEISGNGIGKSSYILGTHHLAPISLLDSIPNLGEILNNCDAEVGEVDMTRNPIELAMSTQQLMVAPQDSTLTNLLTPEEFADLDTKYRKFTNNEGIPLQMLGMLRPMAISALITMNLMKSQIPDFNPELQLDSFIQSQFKQKGKKIIALETPEQQAKLIYQTLPIQEQLKDLKELLDDPQYAMTQAKELNSIYFSKDIEKLLEISNKEDSNPEFTFAILKNRNMEWSKKLPEIIKSQPCFIAVGALHLPGEEGVLQLLKNEGFEITPIW